MSDLAIAGILLAFLISLAVTAPIWGYDSRDGVESDQPARRVAWLHDRNVKQTYGPTRTVSATLAGALRLVAYRLDGDAARSPRPDQRLAEAC